MFKRSFCFGRSSHPARPWFFVPKGMQAPWSQAACASAEKTNPEIKRNNIILKKNGTPEKIRSNQKTKRKENKEKSRDRKKEDNRPV